MQFPDDTVYGIPMLRLETSLQHVKSWKSKVKSLRIATVFIQPLMTSIASIVWVCNLGMGECGVWADAKTSKTQKMIQLIEFWIVKSPNPHPQAILDGFGWSKCCACAKAPGPSRDPRTPPKRTADTALAGFEGSNLRNSMVFLDYLGFAKKWDLTDLTIKNHQEPSRTGISRIWLWQWGIRPNLWRV